MHWAAHPTAGKQNICRELAWGREVPSSSLLCPHHSLLILRRGKKAKAKKRVLQGLPFPPCLCSRFGPVSQGNGAHIHMPCGCHPVLSLSEPSSQSKALSPARSKCAQGGGIVPPPASPPPHGIPWQHRAPCVAAGTAGTLGATDLSLPVMPGHVYVQLPGRDLQPSPRTMTTCSLISPAPLCSSPCSHGTDVPRAHRTHQGWTHGAPNVRVPPAATACPAGRSPKGAHAGQCSRRLGATGPAGPALAPATLTSSLRLRVPASPAGQAPAAARFLGGGTGLRQSRSQRWPSPRLQHSALSPLQHSRSCHPTPASAVGTWLRPPPSAVTL
ncbi:uncharacterized protein LOC121077868 [Cygnus olor]|uniref:uncharacterized protein LOC121077868 n=1 Tax=Cygnus olor TaxID=8869 RepID=UPI001ADE5EE6|nr:uncharacterized protein LOC121077868 [Cygnus olor]